jgi:hypothetical protein
MDFETSPGKHLSEIRLGYNLRHLPGQAQLHLPVIVAPLIMAELPSHSPLATVTTCEPIPSQAPTNNRKQSLSDP